MLQCKVVRIPVGRVVHQLQVLQPHIAYSIVNSSNEQSKRNLHSLSIYDNISFCDVDKPLSSKQTQMIKIYNFSKSSFSTSIEDVIPPKFKPHTEELLTKLSKCVEMEDGRFEFTNLFKAYVQKGNCEDIAEEMTALLSPRFITNLHPTSVVLLLFSFGKMKLNLTSPHMHETLKLLSERALEKTPDLKHFYVTNLLNGLTSCGFKWTMFDNKAKKDLLEMMTRSIPQVTVMDTPDILFSINTLGLRWSLLSKDLQNVLLESLTAAFQDGLKSQRKASAVISLKEMGFSVQDAHSSVVDKFAAVLVHSVHRGKWLEDLDKCHVLTNLCYSFAFMGFEFASGARLGDKAGRHNPLITALMARLAKGGRTDFTGGNINSILISFVEMKLRWADLSVELKDKIVSNLSRVPQDGNSGVTLHSLQKMGARWTDLSPQLQEVLFDYNVTNSACDNRNVAKSFYALGKLKFDIHQNASEAGREKMYRMASNVLADHTFKEYVCMSDLMFGLANIGCRKNSMPSHLLAAVERCLETNLTQCGLLSVSIITHALGKMDIQWEHLSPNARLALDFALNKHLPGFEEQLTVSAIISLQKMGVAMSDLSANLQFAVYNGLAMKMLNMYPQEVANGLSSLAKMDVFWYDLHKDFISAVNNALIEKMPFMNRTDVFNTLNGLGRFKFQINADTTRPALRETIIEAAERVLLSDGVSGDEDEEEKEKEEEETVSTTEGGGQQQEVGSKTHHMSNIILSLGKCGVTWCQLPASMVQSIALSLRSCSPPVSNQNMAVLLQGLFLLKAQWVHLPVELRAYIMERLAQPDVFCLQNPHHVAMTIFALGELGVEWSGIPSGIQRNLQRCAQTCLKDMSHLHIYFLMVGLREMNCSWADLTPDIRAGIVSYIERKFISIVEKDVSGVANALALMTFDQPLDTGIMSMHRHLLAAIGQVGALSNGKLAVYFEVMASRPETQAMVVEILGEAPDVVVEPRTSVDDGSEAFTLPTLLENELRKTSGKYHVLKNCSGLKSGAFMMQLAVYHNSDFVAFIDFLKEQERSSSRVLQLKDYLYATHLPHVPVLHFDRVENLRRGNAETFAKEIASKVLSGRKNV